MSNNLQTVVPIPDDEESFTNKIFYSMGVGSPKDCYIKINDYPIFVGESHNKVKDGCIAINKLHRLVYELNIFTKIKYEVFKPPKEDFELTSVLFKCFLYKMSSGIFKTFIISKDYAISILKKILLNHILVKNHPVPLKYKEKTFVYLVDKLKINKNDVDVGKITKNTKIDLCIGNVLEFEK